MPICDRSSFKPAWWLPGPHLQTLWQPLTRRFPQLRTLRERLATADGDFLDLDWFGTPAQPIVILLHGLTGSSRSAYIQGMQSALARHGFRSVAVNFRGCSGQPNQTARGYHSGETGDLNYVYHILSRRYPETPLAAVGYSLGGNMLLKWLGEQGNAVRLFAAAAVSVPLLLDRCADRMDCGFSRVYRNHLVGELKDYIRCKQNHLQAIGNDLEAERLRSLGDLSRVRSFWEYDDRVVARLYDFWDVHDYYEKSSSRQYLKRIHLPTLVIQARDDPFMTASVLPEDHELSSFVHLEITTQGGHVGFISGRHPGRPQYWLEHRIPAFLRTELDRVQKL
ncbi:hydrolase [Methylocaldum sp.]|uniref:hydrolase n=1 Tax=Methylocaldum sp. TaxID=1969727 RepID=UPI002D60E109|nr:hydrolase [Methylocaldum sp.]HYE37082.1 hydrolase [Methylocaldum sp.]